MDDLLGLAGCVAIAGTLVWRLRQTMKPTVRGDPLDERYAFAGGLISRRELDTGVLLTGQVGSGKTSTLKSLLGELLREGCGAFIPASKPDSAEAFLKLCRDAGRRDVVVVDGRAGGPCVNFFDALARGREPATEALMLASGADQIFQVLSRNSDSGGENARYWQSGYERMLRMTALLHLLAGEKVSIASVVRVLQSAPDATAELATPKWKAGLCSQLLERSFEAARRDPRLQADQGQVFAYWTREVAGMEPKSRSTFKQFILGPSDILSRGVVSRVLGSPDPTLDLKEVVRQNRIVVTTMSYGTDREMATAINCGLKYLFQLEILSRSTARLPYVLAVDEWQLLLSSFDFEYVSLQRSSRGPMIVATQGVESIHALFPGENGRSKVGGLIGNLGVQLYCNPTVDTSKHLVELVGQGKRTLMSGSSQAAAYANPMELMFPGPAQASGSVNQTVTNLLTPSKLRRMRCGGGANGGIVDFYAVIAGRKPCFASIRQE